jgi:hypothetical protein
MSYEGYTDHLCENGHHWQIDAQAHYVICPYCSKDSVWQNEVDETNCDSVGIIMAEGWKSLCISEKKIETCGHCNHSRTMEPARYRIPSEEELKKLRHLRLVGDNGKSKFMNIYEYHLLSDVLEG